LREVVLASRNEGKLAELQALLEPLGVRLRLVSDFTAGVPPEDGATFVENALLKARHAARAAGLPAIADDSGIEVDALGGAPGVRSARFAADAAGDAANNARLLADLAGVPEDRRGARYVCVLALLRHPLDPTPVIAQGTWSGRILAEPRGANGFGYDPLFFVAGHGKTAAELPAALKNRLSHRARAAAELLAKVRETGWIATP
jgi:XTP/dITP diphosphohydrolase